jgi:hypothetical protein
MKAILHWNLQKKMWTIHTYKGCEWATHIRIRGEWYTEIKPNKPSNPRGWVVVDREQVEILNDKDSPILVGEQLTYDKINKEFNFERGNGLLFLPNGAFLVAD